MISVSLSSNRRHPPSLGEEKTRSSDLSHNREGVLVRAELAVLHRARSAGQLAVVVIRCERAQRSERNDLYFILLVVGSLLSMPNNTGVENY